MAKISRGKDKKSRKLQRLEEMEAGQASPPDDCFRQFQVICRMKLNNRILTAICEPGNNDCEGEAHGNNPIAAVGRPGQYSISTNFDG